ncbi:MAG: Gfo/Idh/MocA family oxidoreductase [Spirochaetes bacterium]|nr:Gfo/Idh/MocA family oxidoreductase [Spirochaetota bacterium]
MTKQLNTGLIGCGGFVKAMHVPNLKANQKYRIHACADINVKAAEALAAETGAAYATDNIDRLLGDTAVDVVFITTTHDAHAALSVKAANAGKHILCEKPMAMNARECREVAAAVKANGVKYTVGYNRGMAPLVVRARELIKPISAKMLIYHRIQAPFPATHWTHNPAVGGGRFIGEGCHIFDLFCVLVDAPPVSVYASGGTFLDPAAVKIPDSGIVTITFADGSIATTLIASDGCPTFPKESTEIVCGGKAVMINDFTSLDYFGFDGQAKQTQTAAKQDKGQALEIDRLADAIINDAEAPNGILQAARAAVISYKVNESIATGKTLSINEQEYCL